MEKCWVKLIKENKLVADCVVEVPNEDNWLDALCLEACRQLDLAVPLLFKKHREDMARFGMTRILPESFMEPVLFDRMELSLFTEKKKP